jgi:hypothetical protein
VTQRRIRRDGPAFDAVRIPDFFIIGASKCGTTALSEYLRQHPNVCFARTKEPHYFSDDYPLHKMDDNLDQYWRRNFSYFDPARHRAIGEGSGTYYRSEVAIPNILKSNPSAKFIYMVRNPVEMIYSWYYDLRFSHSENVSLEQGWDLQPIRARGLEIPKLCPDPRILEYRKLASLGRRLEVFKQIIPPDQLMVIVFDDFVRDPGKVYEAVLKFIGIPSDGRTDFPVVNSSKIQRSRLVGRFSASIPRWFYNAVREFKHLAGLADVPLNFIARLNAKPAPKQPLSREFKQRLLVEFEPEIRLLELHLGRDLNTWRAIEPNRATADS